MKKTMLAVIGLMAMMFGAAYAEDPAMPSEEQMMKAWMEAATPGPIHTEMAKMAGEWDCTTKFWMDPKQPAMESKGTCTHTVVNGGRAIQQAFHGDMMGMPFEGTGFFGYDNFTKMYWSTWMDNMITGCMYMEGTSEDGGKTIIYNTTMDEPAMNVKDKPVRMVSRMIDDDTHVFESWDEVGTPHEFKAMEITYKRKK